MSFAVDRRARIAEAAVEALHAARREAQEATARAESLRQELRLVVEVANDAFVALDADQAIVEWSTQAERVFGWARSEVLGRQFAIIPPDVAATPFQRIDEVVPSDDGRCVTTRIELQAQHRDGHLIPVEATVWAAAPGGTATLHVFIRDLTPGARGGDSGCRMGSIVESSAHAIIGASLDGRILTWNAGAEQIYGYPAHAVIGHPLRILAPPGRQDELGPIAAAASDGDVAVLRETVRQRADGTLVEVEESMAVTRDAAGGRTGLSLIARDVSEERRMAAALATALEEARESETRSRRFLADAAHQLRTPIAGIQACTQAILRGASQAERDGLLAGVVQETSRAGRLMAGLLQMARLDRGEALALAPCDLVKLCRDEAERTRRLAPHLRVAVDPAPGWSGEQPVVDANAVAEILGNLLDNARRHTSSRIDVTVRRLADDVLVRVADDGPGVAVEMAEQVFERFVSLDRRGGSGLGLAIGRGLARAHGGDLTYESRAFVLRLPLGDAPDTGPDTHG